MKITQVNNRYFIEIQGGRLHVLNAKSLAWNLKRLYGMNTIVVKEIIARLDAEGSVELVAA
jgi:hypothetical protein